MFDARRAVRLQRMLAGMVLDSLGSPRDIDPSGRLRVAGVDAAFHHGMIVGVAVLVDYPSGSIIRYSVVEKKVHVPYIPGLLAFREAPAYIAAVRKLGEKPDILMVDGHGLTHPRGLGIASHLGLVLDLPSIGVAKKRLYGEERSEEGHTYIYAHGLRAGEIIEHRGRKLYISIGYAVTLETAVTITKKLLRDNTKLPIPTEAADKISKKIARQKRKKGPVA